MDQIHILRAAFLTVRKVPIRADSRKGMSDAIFLENEALIVDDADIEALWKSNHVVCRVERVPEGFRRHAYVHLASRSGKPIRRFINKRAEYDLVAFVAETPRVFEFESRKWIEIVLESPVASLARGEHFS